jgi:hypothetical protein
VVSGPCLAASPMPSSLAAIRRRVRVERPGAPSLPGRRGRGAGEARRAAGPAGGRIAGPGSTPRRITHIMPMSGSRMELAARA